MDVSEEAADARAAAVAEVCRLMQHPEHLRRLPELRAEYEAKRASNAARLSAAVAAHVDAVRTGSARLDDAARALARLRACYAAIDGACGVCSDLVARPDAVAALAAAHAAATDALRGAEAVAALPAEAARAEAMLAGGARLADVHECLAALEGTAAAARRALEGAAAGERAAAVAAAVAAARGGGPGAASAATPPPPPPPPPPLSLAATTAPAAVDALGPYLDRVRAAGRTFEDRLWATVRGCVRGLGRSRPAALVDAARVIEAQEAVDRHLEAAGPGAPRPKRWWARACAQVAMAVQDAAAPLLASCSRLGAAGTDTDGAVRAILADAQAFVVELAGVFDYAAPCFARRAAFFDAAARAVADGVAAMAEALAAAASAGHLANADILRVLAWVDAYAATLDELGVGYLAAAGAEAEAARAAAPAYLPTPPGLAAPVRALVTAYSARAKAALAGWTRTMLATDLGAPPSQAADGLLWTPGAVDFFRSANEQLAAVEESTRGELLYATAADILDVMADFQAAQLAAIASGTLDDAHLAALVNNNARAHRESADLADRLVDAGCGGGGLGGGDAAASTLSTGFAIEPASRPALDVEAACRGFLDVAAAATRALAARTLAGDAALGALLAKAACSADWRAGGLTPSVAATLVDYHGDYAALIEPAFAKRLAEALLRGAAGHFAAAALALVPTKGGAGPDASPAPAASASASAFTGGWWTPADTARLRSDAAALADAMAPHCRSGEAAARATRALTDLAGLVGADSPDDAALAYSALLQSSPSLVPAMVDRLLAARADWTKADVKAAGVAVREAFALARGGGGGASAATTTTTPASSPLRLVSAAASTSTPGPPPTPAVATAVKDAGFRAALAALMEGGN